MTLGVSRSRWDALLRVGFVSALAVSLLLLPDPARGSVSGGCTGEATIDGVTYTPANDTPSNPVVIPVDKEGVVASWKGSVNFENKNHSGQLQLALPIGSVQIAKWGHPNPGNATSASGTYQLDDLWEMLGFKITGMYTVSGSHSASGGSCSGFAVVKFAGSPLGTPLGIVVVVGGVITGIMTIWAGVPKKGP